MSDTNYRADDGSSSNTIHLYRAQPKPKVPGVFVTCPGCRVVVDLPIDTVDESWDRRCPVCRTDLPYLPEVKRDRN